MTSPRPLRLAILEADIPLASTRAKYGSYGGVFTSLLHKGADAIRLPRDRLELTGWDVVNDVGPEDHHHQEEKEEEEECCGGMYNWRRRRGYPALADVDAVLITGS
ncbi:MAG: hypothetical protein Q9163_006108, partial [Psora crenata]